MAIGLMMFVSFVLGAFCLLKGLGIAGEMRTKRVGFAPAARVRARLDAAGLGDVSLAALAGASVTTALLLGALAVIVLGNPLAAIALAGMGLLAPLAFVNARAARSVEALGDQWPDALDDIRSSLHAEMALEQATIALASSAAEDLRPYFEVCADIYRRTGDYAYSLRCAVQRPIATAEADRVVETLIVAAEIGDLQVAAERILHASESLREIRQAREELRGQLRQLRWVARCGVAMPWIVLMLFSFGDPSMLRTGAGPVIVGVGILWSIGSYQLVRKAMRLPIANRVWAPASVSDDVVAEVA